ncbi:hypothetical protein TRICI_000965 [Trichomonascus ciferrii]|uniref:Uncharacterized protein n=1 Tax=Trichomonascus ciferrii TaxID=44093 RepID=A0A642VBP7_9ASCO|nr:hypothetical protein TRICI_000965 [Trichomonascus ciferrii]
MGDKDDELKYLSEYLARIKAVAISIQLPSECNIDKLSFEDTRKAIVHYQGKDGDERRAIMYLPEEVSYSVTQVEHPVAETTNTISFRLPAVPNERGNGVKTSSFFDSSKLIIPWSASELTGFSGDIDVKCGNCSDLLGTHSNSMNWKQLPSENWAEMMDFWHCHKPENKNETTHNPGYAISRFVPTETTSFVGLSYFLFSPTLLSGTQHQKNRHVHCNSCNTALGVNENNDSLKLWKWNLRLENSDLVPQYKDYVYVSTMISDLIDSHAIYTFSIKIDEDPVDSPTRLLLWIFNPDVRYTTTGCTDKKSGFKIFYSTDKKNIPSLMQSRGDIEPVILPVKVYESFLAHLETTSNVLPENYRWFGNWRASIAEKL